MNRLHCSLYMLSISQIILMWVTHIRLQFVTLLSYPYTKRNEDQNIVNKTDEYDMTSPYKGLGYKTNKKSINISCA
jgi:hypothetical protein